MLECSSLALVNMMATLLHLRAWFHVIS
jgi:hypothetical protein